MTPTISVTGLTRRYRDHVALDRVSFEVEAGSVMSAASGAVTGIIVCRWGRYTTRTAHTDAFSSRAWCTW